MIGIGTKAMMKAVVCLAPLSITIEARPLPIRAHDEVLLKINRAGICGTDYHIYEGKHPFLNYPRVIGHELSATVVDTPSSNKFKIGQKVAINPYIACGTCHACKIGKPNCCMNIAVLGVHRDGGMCEYISVPERNLISADGLTLDEAATVEFLAIGAHAVRRSSIGRGERALVVGAGPIGLGVAIFAKIAGADVTLVDRDSERLSLASAATGIANTIIANSDGAAKIMQQSNDDGPGPLQKIAHCERLRGISFINFSESHRDDHQRNQQEHGRCRGSLVDRRVVRVVVGRRGVGKEHLKTRASQRKIPEKMLAGFNGVRRDHLLKRWLLLAKFFLHQTTAFAPRALGPLSMPLLIAERIDLTHIECVFWF